MLSALGWSYCRAWSARGGENWAIKWNVSSVEAAEGGRSLALSCLLLWLLCPRQTAEDMMRKQGSCCCKDKKMQGFESQPATVGVWGGLDGFIWGPAELSFQNQEMQKEAVVRWGSVCSAMSQVKRWEEAAFKLCQGRVKLDIRKKNALNVTAIEVPGQLNILF